MQKKILGSSIALAMLLTFGQANASELLKGLTWSGQIDLQGTNGTNLLDFGTNGSPAAGTQQDRIGNMQTRVLITADWEVVDGVKATATLRKNDRSWGTAGNAPINANANSQSVGDNAAGTDVMGNIFIDQANIKIDKLMGLDTTLGRQFYGEAGDLVIYYGPHSNQFGLGVGAIDAARFDWSNDSVGITALVGKVTGTGVGTALNSDLDVHGITASLKGNENLNAGLYLYRMIQHNAAAALGTPANDANAGGVNSFLYIVGAKAKATFGPAWLGGEIAKNFGTSRDSAAGTPGTVASRTYAGWAAKLDLGAKADISGIGAIAPWAHVGFGTGDGDTRDKNNNGFQAINGDYRPGTIMGRFAQVGGIGAADALGGQLPNAGGDAIRSEGTLTNRVIFGFGVKITPSAWEKLTAGLSLWDFSTQTSASPIGASRRRPFGGNKHIGSEIDVDASWKHSDNVNVGFGVAQFMPGGIINEANQPAGGPGTGTGTNPAQLAYFDVKIKWGK